MSAAPGAMHRLGRLLSLVPWVASHTDGVPVDEVCRRFEVSRSELVTDLDTVMMVGVHPFTPDTLIDAWIEDDRVVIRYAESFVRPLRLTPDEAVSLVAAARGLSAVPGPMPVSALTSAIDKIAAVLGPEGSDRLEVDLGDAPTATFSVLESARDRRVQAEIVYAKPGEEPVARRIEVQHLFSSAGRWYVSGWCHLSNGPRVFRVDRIQRARETDDPCENLDVDSPAEVAFGGVLPEVTLDVDRSLAWLFDAVPVKARSDEDTAVRLTIAVASPQWLARTLVQLGPAARVVADPEHLEPGRLARELARSLSELYR